jgi:hypothetical protein
MRRGGYRSLADGRLTGESGMTDKLRVDYRTLQDIEKDLVWIKKDFEHHTNPEYQKSLRGNYGSAAVADAMDEFTENWRKNRRQFLHKVGDLGTWVHETHTKYYQLDCKLAKECKGG